MASLNRATLIGNVGGDPEVRTLNNGDKVVSFSLATSESWKDKATGEKKERTNWHRIVCFNQHIGDVIENYVSKGSKILIEGSIETRKYEKDGQDRYVTEIVLRQFGGNLVLLPSSGGQAARNDPDSYGTTRSRSTDASGEPKAGASTSQKESWRDKAPIDDSIPF